MRQRGNKSTLPSVEDLLKVVLEAPSNTATPTVVKANKSGDDVIGFIYFYKFAKGRNQVPLTLVKGIYDLWSKNPVNVIRFNKRMRDFFGNGSRKGKYIYINIAALELADSVFGALKPPEVRYAKLDKIREFLEYKNIRSGSYYVHAIPLYVLFCNYMNIDFVNHCGYSIDIFRRVLRLFFKEKTTSKFNAYFGIHSSLKKTILTPEFAKKAVKRYNNVK